MDYRRPIAPRTATDEAGRIASCAPDITVKATA
jgi:hypothetical protein